MKNLEIIVDENQIRDEVNPANQSVGLLKRTFA